MTDDFQSQPSTQNDPTPRGANRDLPQGDGTRQAIHNLSQPNGDDSTRDRIHRLSEPRQDDPTRAQIHKLSETDEKDSTREQIHDLSNFHLSEKLGLPLLAGDTADGSSNASSASKSSARKSGGWFGFSSSDNEDPNHVERTQSPLSVFSRNDWTMIYAGSAMVLLPLLGGYLFVR